MIDIYLERALARHIPEDFQDCINGLYRFVQSDEIDSKELEYIAIKAYLSIKCYIEDKRDNISHYNFGNYVIVNVVYEKKNFLAESIVAQLKRSGVNATHIMHSSYNCAENTVKILQFRIYDEKNEEFIRNLLQKIANILLDIEMWERDAELMKLDLLKTADYMAEEESDFINWLARDNFFILGSSFVAQDCEILQYQKKSGILDSNDDVMPDISSIIKKSSNNISVTKIDKRSTIHRTAHLDVIIFKYNTNHYAVIVGLFAPSVYKQDINEIPIIRKKVWMICQRAGCPERSITSIQSAIEMLPRSQLLQIDADSLYQISMEIYDLYMNPKIRLFMMQDIMCQFINVIVFIPEKYFSTEVRQVIETILNQSLNATLSKRYIQMGETDITKLQLTLKLKKSQKIDADIASMIEAKIKSAVINWDEEFLSILRSRGCISDELNKYLDYIPYFDQSYKLLSTPLDALEDIDNIAMISECQHNKVFSLKSLSQNEHKLRLKIYSKGEKLNVSSFVGVLENFGLEVLDIRSQSFISDKDEIYISFLEISASKYQIVEIIDDKRCQDIKDALLQIEDGVIENDYFNALIVYCGLDCKEANLVRAYCKYLKQTKYNQSMEYTVSVLLSYPYITKAMIALFDRQFNKERGLQNKQTSMDVVAISKEIKEQLVGIKSANEDKVIRGLLEVILATLRSNFYQKKYRNYLAFKLDSCQIKALAEPKPYVEIFVYSASFEGIHLRGSKIARGGLRWSDRPEDFRTEILGLMKAQMTKNAVIVPMGSKGGFILKKADMTKQDSYMAEAVSCYKEFLRGLLDLTDNIIDNNILHPEDTVVLDDEDPYLVVAADKGTATFSDYANAVSKEYNFWLGDAFASGGSCGYDHKKMAITARGTWVSIQNHLTQMNHNDDVITCVGIGDMSGDVFGNGMLLQNNIKLIAAFNHEHIFIDPNPDIKISFNERKRLFQLPRSKWSDYDKNCLSKGGAIFERKAKTIELSDEAMYALSLNSKQIIPDDLIKAILCANVDLLFNGGIGTYAKSQLEANENIGDKTNDNVRVLAKDIKAKIVGEGGNLGFTQLARVEFANHGGFINTDFIDNSAGVDCSDHEVNIKIAFSALLNEGSMLEDERNASLESLVEDIAELVLNDNKKQNILLNLEQFANNSIQTHAWLIKELESSNKLRRDVEYLPNDEILSNMIASNKPLTRPEISVLMAYAKNSIFQSCSNINWCDDVYFEKILFSYFPSKMYVDERIKKSIATHKLKNQIVASVLANEIVNMLGITFVHQILDEVSPDIKKLMYAFVIAAEILHAKDNFALLELDQDLDNNEKYKTLTSMQNIMKKTIRWILYFHDNMYDVDELIQRYNSNLNKVMLISKCHDSNPQNINTSIFLDCIKTMSCKLYLLNVAYLISNDISLEPNSIFAIYQEIDMELSISWLFEQAQNFVSRHYIQNIAIQSLLSELTVLHMRITLKRYAKENSFNTSMYYKYQQYIKEISMGNTLDSLVSKMVIAIRLINQIAMR